jgi:hypothetical protein
MTTVWCMVCVCVLCGFGLCVYCMSMVCVYFAEVKESVAVTRSISSATPSSAPSIVYRLPVALNQFVVQGKYSSVLFCTSHFILFFY